MSVVQCSHKDRKPGGRICLHLMENGHTDYAQRFAGAGTEYDLVCDQCKKLDEIESVLICVCKECFVTVEKNGCWDGICGNPEVLVRESNLRFQHEDIELPDLTNVHILDIQPIEASAGAWSACTSTGTLLDIRPAQRSVRVAARVPQDALDFDGSEIRESKRPWPKGSACVLQVSRNGDLAAVANRYGDKGIVMDLVTGKPIMSLLRDKYHEDVSSFPLAFVDMDNRLLLIHGTAWNRLDVSDARTGTLLTERGPTSYKKDETRPKHYLDYFHSSLLVSPNQQFVADNGWVWQPYGVVATWNIPHWLHEDVWESDDGKSQKWLCWRAYYWDGPLCWLDDHRLAVWGYGEDDEWLIPAVLIFDVLTGKKDHWFAGPKGSLVFDEYLFSFDKDEGTSVWDVATGERLLREREFFPIGYHRGAKQFLSLLDGGKVRVSSLVGGK
jgi:hypothetical protein